MRNFESKYFQEIRLFYYQRIEFFNFLINSLQF